eukprot:CAMPEP_0179300526 /NCGR_PEP_ID=MMETSP0797-20121207/47078_1 /TAXON_ID=47934 /ORGANISM="Dinophysis acuminata, Strain DAEP01" /LENGTH=369 /DNA_ID=CAMNT_0021009995 /DNA_START=10 /DNA_END=1119 /DNA_ORIENTATION=+
MPGGLKRKAAQTPSTEKSASRSKTLAASLEQHRPVANPMVCCILEAIKMADSLPERCRNMLSAVAPSCMLTPANERHAHQVKCVTMIEEVFDTIQSKMRENVTTDEARFAEVRIMKTSHESKLKLLADTLATQSDEVNLKQSSHNQSAKVVTDAEAVVAEAQEACAKADAALARARQDKATLENALTQALPALTGEEGEWDAEKAGQHVDAAVAAAMCTADGNTYAGAISRALAKPPADRSDFEGALARELGRRLRSHAAALEGALRAGSAASGECAAVAREKRGLLGEARTCEEDHAAKLAAAVAARHDVVADLRKVQAESDALAPEYERAEERRDRSAAVLEDFKSQYAHCFAALRDATVRVIPADA